MPSTRTFDRNVGGDAIAFSDKSIVNAPAGFYDNISGCLADVDQYGRWSAAATLNSRLNCSAPAPVLQVSYSGLGMRSGRSPAGLGSAYDGYATSEVLGPTGMYARLTIGNIAGVRRGNSFILNLVRGDDTSVIITTSVPRIIEVVDQCGSVAGYKYSVTRSVSAIDRNTCIPYLLNSESLSVYHDNLVTPSGDPATGLNNFTVLIPYLESIPATLLDGTSTAEQVGGVIAALATSTFVGQEVTLPLPA